jgi:ribosomal-protein-alanine N-acetyltransferase
MTALADRSETAPATPHHVLRLRYMALSDIPQVVQMDEDAFSTPWSARTYAYEIMESPYSHMLVVEMADAQAEPRSQADHLGQGDTEHMNRASSDGAAVSAPTNRLDRFLPRWARRAASPATRLRRLADSLNAQPPVRKLVAYGGLWRVLEEAHISTIASHADFRGRGYGELSLLSMMRRGMTLGADFVALEVRVSNSIAQNLYLKHGFRVQGVKHHYYRDDGEDAYDMRLYYTQAVCGQIEASYAELRRRHAFIDRYSDQAVQS